MKNYLIFFRRKLEELKIVLKDYLTLNPFPERKGLFHLSFREGAGGRSIFNLSRYMMNADCIYIPVLFHILYPFPGRRVFF